MESGGRKGNARQGSKRAEILLVPITVFCSMPLKEKAVTVPMEIARCSNLEPEEAAALYRILYKMLGKQALCESYR